MKKFVVSEKCIACGNCLLETKLLQEDAEGKAVPANGGYFSDDFLAKAEEIVAGCPVQALSIAEGAGADLSKLPEKLQNALAKITVPNVTRKDVEMHAQDYRMTCSYPQGEYRYDYSSESRAMSAAENEFDRICYSQYKKFILEVFVQYKEDKLRKFYTFDESGFGGRLTSNMQMCCRNLPEQQLQVELSFRQTLKNLRFSPAAVLMRRIRCLCICSM